MKVPLFLLLVPLFIFCQSKGINKSSVINLGEDWYQTTSYVTLHEDLTPAKARENAINHALNKIIEDYSGVKISSLSLSIMTETNQQIEIDHFSQLINTTASGIILKREIIHEEKKTRLEEWIYEVTVRAKVGKLLGESDPFFKLKANLNRHQYHDNDEMIINITSSKNCFVYVFNILSDESVTTLFPNKYLKNNFISKGDSLRLPPIDGIITKFRVGLPEYKTQATELIMVLGIKAEKNTNEKDFDLNLGGYKMAFKELSEFIVGFHRDQVEQVTLPYVITY